MLREKFEKSKQPSTEQLKIGKSWDCKEYHAVKDSFYQRKLKNLLKLEEYNGLIENSGIGRIESMAFNGSALVGVNTSSNGEIFIRVTEDGDLIAENTDKPKSTPYEFNDDIAIRAISDKSTLVATYVVCPVSLIH